MLGESRSVASWAVWSTGVLALAACGDGYYAPGGAWATAELRDVQATRAEDGTTRIDAKLRLQLEVYDEDDEVALDEISVVGEEAPVDVVDIAFDESEWPAAVALGETVEREVRLALRASPTAGARDSICATSVFFDLRVGLLNASGRTEATVVGEAVVAGSGPRLGLTRSFSDVAAGGSAPYATALTATVDGAGTQWVMARDGYPATSRLVSRSPDGVVVEEAQLLGGTMAPAMEGVVVVAVDAGRARVSLRRRNGETAWQTEIDGAFLSSDFYLPVAVARDRVIVAIPGYGVTAPGLPTTPATGGTTLITFDPDGTPRAAVTVPFAGVVDVATSDDLDIVAYDSGLVALREGAPAWSSSRTPWTIEVTASGDVVAAGDGWVDRLRGVDGALRTTTDLGVGFWPTSIGVRDNDEILLASNGTVARVGVDGSSLFEGEVLCSGVVAFGGSAPRVAFATLSSGLEAWGDGPDRETATTIMTLGEVLP